MSNVAPRIAFKTFGCRSNFADTNELQARIVERGGVPCSPADGANVYVINSCTVTNQADAEVIDYISQLRRRNPTARIIVTGCMAETSPDKLHATGFVDGVVGPADRASTVAAIFGAEAHARREAPKRKDRRQSVNLAERISYKLAGPNGRMGEEGMRARYHLRVQEGCDNFCTFCIIPFSRGQLNSRPSNLISDDIIRLSSLGYEEIVLTGTHLGGYGEDIGTSLVQLLRELSALKLPIRLRLSSIDPNDVTDELIDLIAGEKSICEHLHVCAQALSDKLLKRMNRRHDLEQFLSVVKKLEAKVEGCCIGSDLITGFPGETRDDVEEQIEIFQKLPVHYLHVFPYSEREGTAAVRLSDSVEPLERKRRAARWRSLSTRRFTNYVMERKGHEIEFVVESIRGKLIEGTSREFIDVEAKLEDVRPVSRSEVKRGMRVIGTAKDYHLEREVLVCG